MNRKAVSGIIVLTLLLTGMLTLAFNIQPVKAEPKTWTVDDDGPADFHTIQEAINAANPGDTVYVKAGTYYEHLSINKNSLTLIGENRDTTIIDSNWTGTVIYITANNIIITGFTIQRGGGLWPYSGIFLYYSFNSYVYNNKATNNSHDGIYLRDCSNVSVYNNDAINNYDGITLYGSSNVSIYNNNVTNNGMGIFLQESFNIAIYNNNVNNNSYLTVSYGIVLIPASNVSIYNNNVTNNEYGMWIKESSNNAIYHNNFINNTQQVYDRSWDLPISPSINTWDNGYPSGGNYWSDYAGVDVNGDGIGDTPYVIDINNTDRYPLMYPWSSLPVHNINTGLGYATIQDAINANGTLNGHTIFVETGTYYEHVILNKTLSLVGEHRSITTVDGSGMGTVVTVSQDNINMTSFTIQDSGFPNAGVQLNNVTQCNIFGNSIINNWFNLDLYSSSNNSINENNIGYGYYGIKLHDSSNHNSISGNSITKTEWGIHLTNSINNTIYGNDITANNWGIELQYSSNNIISGNNITANMAHGIWLGRSSTNRIYQNNVANNSDGVGIYESLNNVFYHNNFMDNTQQVYFLTSSYANFWDDGYPSGGNYWSDYVGVDVKSGPGQDLPGNDGIGDTSYVIDANNTDHYPLMNPYGAPPPQTYALTITSTVGGTTDPAPGTYSYTANSTVPVTAIPDVDYEFDYWELDGANVGSANPYTVLMDKDHALKAVFSLIPPPLSASINPLSASINVGESVTFTSTVSGGYTPYTYQWYLDGAPVSEANESSWKFTPTASGIYYVHLKIADAKGNTTQSETARITVAAVPVGGYSIPIRVHTKAEPVLPYIALIVALTAIFITVKRKTKRKH